MPMTPQQLSQQLQALPADKRIIFIHPNFKAQHLILTNVLGSSVYVRIQGQKLDEEHLREQLDAAVQEQIGTTRLDGKVHYVVLDECDRVLPEAFARFMRRFIADVDYERVIILSRVLPDTFLSDETLRERSGFIPGDARLMLWEYAQTADKILLEVRAFGEGRVHLSGQLVDTWDGVLPRALFFYLIDRGMVTRAEIFQTFWPNLSTREATNVFHVTKRKISEVLGTELTIYGSSFYHISPKIELSYDVSLFNQLVQDSDNENGNIDTLQQAISLYRGDYLTSMSADWVLHRRESLQQTSCDTLVSLGKLCESSEPQQALGYYLHATRMRPEREDAAYAVMRLFREAGMPKDALRIYQRLADTLRARLKVTPSSQIQQLAAQIEREQRG